MKKKFKFMILALVAMCGFASCSEEHDDCIHVDHSADLVGTWICFTSNYAEALVISADGTAISTGVEDGEYWENVRGTIKAENNKMTMTFEDNDNYEGSFDIIPGQAFSLVDRKTGLRFTYRYCANDLADEIVGMWVCNDGPADLANDMMIQTFNEDGSSVMTGHADEILVNDSSTTYKVVGDLLFLEIQKESIRYEAFRMTYSPNGTSFGDIMTLTLGINANIAPTTSWLRVKQDLDLEDQKYNYIKTYVSNVSGEDKDIDFMGYTFNFAKMDGSGLDKMLKALLFAVEFPDANTLGYSYQMNGNKETYNSPIVVEGNKMTIKMSAKVPTLKDVVLYAFQDADCSQMHFYMHKTAFVSFYTNMQAMLMAATNEQFDITNAEAVNAIYDNINNAVETINVSLVMSK